MHEPGPVVVLGMHRSGTSVLTEIVAKLGLNLSRHEWLVPANANNPRGHFEDWRVVEVNEWLLRNAGQSSDTLGRPLEYLPQDWEVDQVRQTWEDLDREGVQVLKDPRLCLTLPWWLRALPTQPVALLLVRNPVEVSGSLYRRQGYPRILGELLWFRYVSASLIHSERITRQLLLHDGMLSTPAQFTGRLADFLHATLGLPMPPILPNSVVDRGLVTQNAEEGVPVLPFVGELWECLRAVSLDGASWPSADSLTPPGGFEDLAQEAFVLLREARAPREGVMHFRGLAEQARSEAEQARSEAEQARSEAEQARSEAEQARSEAEQARSEAEQARSLLRDTEERSEALQAENVLMVNSLSWQATSPMRALAGRLRNQRQNRALQQPNDSQEL